jgi:hypothetical protein
MVLIPKGLMKVARQFTAWKALQRAVPSRRDGLIGSTGILMALSGEYSAEPGSHRPYGTDTLFLTHPRQ